MATVRTARGNRIGLVVIGVLLVLAGLAILACSQGYLGAANEHARVLTGAEGRWVAARSWVWPVIGAVGFVVALLCLRWLIVQLRRDGVGALQLEEDLKAGTTSVPTSVVASAVTAEIEDYAGVSRASATFAGSPTRPELRLTVSLRERADLPAVRTRVEDEAIVHVTEALEIGTLPLLLVFRLDVAKPA